MVVSAGENGFALMRPGSPPVRKLENNCRLPHIGIPRKRSSALDCARPLTPQRPPPEALNGVDIEGAECSRLRSARCLRGIAAGTSGGRCKLILPLDQVAVV
jgi:hypothetical protein